jgi:anti-sigma B factor antagonist
MHDAAAGRLKLTIDRRDGGVVVRADGEVDLDSAEALAAGLRTADDGSSPVVVDLTGVPFMDSSGLRALLVASSGMGERLAVVMSPGSPVAHLLQIAEVADRFRVYRTVEEATDAWAGG